MKPDETLALAREARLYSGEPRNPSMGRMLEQRITRFADLIEAKLMERLLAGAGEPHYWAQRLEDDTVNMVPFYYPDQLAAAVLREREECAKVCVEVGGRDSDSHAWDAADAIRAGGGQ